MDPDRIALEVAEDSSRADAAADAYRRLRALVAALPRRTDARSVVAALALGAVAAGGPGPSALARAQRRAQKAGGADARALKETLVWALNALGTPPQFAVGPEALARNIGLPALSSVITTAMAAAEITAPTAAALVLADERKKVSLEAIALGGNATLAALRAALEAPPLPADELAILRASARAALAKRRAVDEPVQAVDLQPTGVPDGRTLLQRHYDADIGYASFVY